jgi:hypothetical protein
MSNMTSLGCSTVTLLVAAGRTQITKMAFPSTWSYVHASVNIFGIIKLWTFDILPKDTYL